MHRSQRGFSLLELVVVLGILSTLGATAVLSAGTTRARIHLSLAAAQVMRDLTLARARAIAGNVDHRLQFEANRSTYQLARVEDGAATPIGEAIPLPAGVVVQSCNGRDGALQFRPRGNAASFGTVVLESGGETKRVVLNIAGHARIA